MLLRVCIVVYIFALLKGNYSSRNAVVSFCYLSKNGAHGTDDCFSGVLFLGVAFLSRLLETFRGLRP